LQLKVGKDDPATRFVAEKVIELAQRGVERIWFERWECTSQLRSRLNC